MPPAIAAFPDIEKLLIGLLQAQVTSTPVFNRPTAHITATTIPVTRIPGANKSIRVDRPIVDIDVFALDHSDSVNVALAVQQVITPMRNVVTSGGVVQSVTTVNGPRWLPEINPALTRYSASYEFHVHA